MTEFVLSRETMNELETFSAKLEQFRNFIDFVNYYIWQEILDGQEGETINQLGCFGDTMSDLVKVRDKELEEIIAKIKPLV